MWKLRCPSFTGFHINSVDKHIWESHYTSYILNSPGFYLKKCANKLSVLVWRKAIHTYSFYIPLACTYPHSRHGMAETPSRYSKLVGHLLEIIMLLQIFSDSPLKMYAQWTYPTKLHFIWPYMIHWKRSENGQWEIITRYMYVDNMQNSVCFRRLFYWYYKL